MSIARALANRPALILADEPTGEVDTKTRDSIVRVFRDLSEKGQTIIVVTHDPAVAKECSRVLRIVDGTINDEGETGQDYTVGMRIEACTAPGTANGNIHNQVSRSAGSLVHWFYRSPSSQPRCSLMTVYAIAGGMIPTSVTIMSMYSEGVKSKAGFFTCT